MSANQEAEPAKAQESPQVCRVCLFEFDQFAETAQRMTEKDKIIDSQLSAFHEFEKCKNCKLTFHKTCLLIHKNSSSCSNTQNQCFVCGLSTGDILRCSGTGKSLFGHFVCLFLSPLFTFTENSFVPLTLDFQRETVEERPCLKCHQPVGTQESRFKCRCRNTSHVYCLLNERMEETLTGSYTDSKDCRFPSLKMDKFTKGTMRLSVDPNLVEQAEQSLIKFTKRTVEVESNWFEFEMVCGDCYDYAETSLFCCKTPKDLPTPDFAQCSVCTLWVHTDEKSCAKERDSDEKLLNHKFGVGNRSKKRPNKKENKSKASKFDMFFVCPNCFGLGAHLAKFDGTQTEPKGHEHLLSHLIVREAALQLRQTDSKLFSVFKSQFQKEYILKLSYYDLIDSLTNTTKETVTTDNELAKLSDRLVDFFSLETVDIDSVLKLYNRLSAAIQSKEELSNNGLLSLADLNALHRLFYLMKEFLVGFKFSESEFIGQFDSVLNEMSDDGCLGLKQQIVPFYERNINGPINEVNSAVELIQSQLINQGHFQKANSKQVPSAEDIMASFELIPSIELLHSVQHNLKDQIFATRKIELLFKRTELQELRSWQQFSQFHEWKSACSVLMNSQFRDPARTELVGQFSAGLVAVYEVNQEIEAELERLNRFWQFQDSNQFLSDLNNNIEALVSVESLESLNRKASILNLTYPKLTLLCSQSTQHHSFVESSINKWKRSSSDVNLKAKIREVIDYAIRSKIALSETSIEFVRLSKHDCDCDSLLNLSSPIGFQEFSVVFGRIRGELVNHPYSYTKLKNIYDERQRLSEQVFEVFKSEIKVSEFAHLKQSIKAIKLSADQLMQHHNELTQLDSNIAYWNSLFDAFGDEVGGQYEISEENLKRLVSAIDNCRLEQAETVSKRPLSRFMIAELKAVQIKVQTRYWILKLQNLANYRGAIPTSFIQTVTESQATAGKSLEAAYMTLDSVVFDRLTEAIKKAREGDVRAVELCQEIADSQQLFSKHDHFVSKINDLLSSLSAFEIDTFPLKMNVTCLFGIAISLKALSEAKRFTELVERRLSDGAQTADKDYDFEASCHRLSRINDFLNLCKLKVSSSEVEVNQLTDTFNSLLIKYNKIRGKLVALNAIAVAYRNTDFSSLAVCKRVQEHKFVKELESIAHLKWLFRRKIVLLKDFHQSFKDKTDSLLRLTRHITASSLAQLKENSRLAELESAVNAVIGCPIDSPKKSRLLAFAAAIQGVFAANEKPAQVIKQAIDQYHEKMVPLKEEGLSRSFGDDLDLLKTQIENVDSVVCSLWEKVQMDSDFRESIEFIKAFLEHSQLHSSLSYVAFTDLKREVEAICSLLEGAPNDYVSFSHGNQPKIQLPETLQLQLSQLKQTADSFNSYAEKHLDSLSLSQQFNLFKSLQLSSQSRLSAYHTDQLHRFFNEVSTKRALFDSLNAKVESALRQQQSSVEFEHIVCSEINQIDLLKSPKKRFLVSSFEVSQFLLKRAYLMVNLWTPNNRFYLGPDELTQELKLIELIDKLRRKNNKHKITRILSVIIDQIEALSYCLYEAFCLKWKANKDHPLRLKESFEAQRESIAKEFIQSLREQQRGVSDQENVTEADIVPTADIFCRFLLNTCCQNIEMWLRQPLTKFQSKISGQNNETTPANDLSKQFLEELKKTAFIEKTTENRKNMHCLAEKLSNWVASEPKATKTSSKEVSLRRRQEPSELGSSAKGLLGNPEMVTDCPRPNYVSRTDDVRKFISALNTRPDLSKELVANDFSFEFVLRSIKGTDDGRLSLRTQFATDGSRHSQKAKVQSIEPDQLTVPKEEESTADCRSSLKKVKTGIEAITFVNNSESLRTTVWRLSLLTVNCQETNTEIPLFSSLNPEGFPYLDKATLFVKSDSFNFASKTLSESTVCNLKHSPSCNGFIGAAAVKSVIEQALDSVASSKISYTSLYGGWFEWPTADRESHGPLSQLLTFAFRSDCFLDCVLTLGGATFKVYIGSAKSISLKMSNWLQLTVRSETSKSLDNFFAVFFNKTICDKQVTLNAKSTEFSSIEISDDGVLTNQKLSSFENVETASPLWPDIVQGIKRLLNEEQ